MVQSEAKKIEVADVFGSNKRANISEDDVKQCLNDLSEFFKEKASSMWEQRMKDKKGSESDVAALDSHGASVAFLKKSLLEINGGMQYLDCFIGMNVQEIGAAVS
jgi:hypothetical protein